MDRTILAGASHCAPRNGNVIVVLQHHLNASGIYSGLTFVLDIRKLLGWTGARDRGRTRTSDGKRSMHHGWCSEGMARSGWRGEGTWAVEIDWVDEPLGSAGFLDNHLLMLLVILEVSIFIY